MIVTFMIIGFIGMVELIFELLPDLPATPTAIVNGGDWIIDTIAGVISVLNYVFTPALMVATIVVVIAIFSFENIYHGVMWILRKIPMINIK